MDLYYSPLSNYSQKVLMALYEKNIEFNRKRVDVSNPEKHQEYLKIYPLGKIPFLVCDDQWEIPESSIIIEYLDTHYPSGPQLIPQDKDQSRQTRCADRMIDFYLTEPIIKLLFAKWKPDNNSDQSKLDKAKNYIDVMYNYLNKELANKPWFMGEEFTLVDCALAPALFYAQNAAPFSKLENIDTYWQRLSSRPSWQKVENEAKPVLKKFIQSKTS